MHHGHSCAQATTSGALEGHHSLQHQRRKQNLPQSHTTDVSIQTQPNSDESNANHGPGGPHGAPPLDSLGCVLSGFYILGLRLFWVATDPPMRPRWESHPMCALPSPPVFLCEPTLVDPYGCFAKTVLHPWDTTPEQRNMFAVVCSRPTSVTLVFTSAFDILAPSCPRP